MVIVSRREYALKLGGSKPATAAWTGREKRYNKRCRRTRAAPRGPPLARAPRPSRARELRDDTAAPRQRGRSPDREVFGLHADRIVGGDRHHRHSHRPVAARRTESTRGGGAHPMQQQLATTRPRRAQLP